MQDAIVVIDGYTLNPGDLSWDALDALGRVTVHDRSEPQQVEPRLADATCVLTNKVPFDVDRLARLPKLRYIGVTATGYNIIDTQAADQRGISVTNVPTYGTDTVAQHAAALLLELARHTAPHLKAVADGRWAGSADWCLPVAPIVELTGKTLAIVGLGRIGLAFAKIAAAMGMQVIAFDTRPVPAAAEVGFDIAAVGLDELFRRADCLSLHCPLTDATHHLVNAQRLSTMKRSAWIINTSRGPLIDSPALADALRHGIIAGAALDVLDREPPSADHPLLDAPNCLITPHIAWYAREARAKLIAVTVDNLKAHQQGRPANVVNKPVAKAAWR